MEIESHAYLSLPHPCRPLFTKSSDKTCPLENRGQVFGFSGFPFPDSCVYPAEPAGLDRISCYRNVQDNDLREFRGYYDMGLCIAFLMHPQISGAPGRNLVLEEVLKEVTSHKDVWVATGSEVAEYWRKAHPRKED